MRLDTLAYLSLRAVSGPGCYHFPYGFYSFQGRSLRSPPAALVSPPGMRHLRVAAHVIPVMPRSIHRAGLPFPMPRSSLRTSLRASRPSSASHMSLPVPSGVSKAPDGVARAIGRADPDPPQTLTGIRRLRGKWVRLGPSSDVVVGPGPEGRQPVCVTRRQLEDFLGKRSQASRPTRAGFSYHQPMPYMELPYAPPSTAGVFQCLS